MEALTRFSCSMHDLQIVRVWAHSDGFHGNSEITCNKVCVTYPFVCE